MSDPRKDYLAIHSSDISITYGEGDNQAEDTLKAESIQIVKVDTDSQPDDDKGYEEVQ